MKETRVQQPGGMRNLSRSATRALDILEYFALVGRPLRAIEIAQALGFSTSSTDQLLKTLVDSAYLMFDGGNKLYYPSPRLVNFGAWLSANYFGGDRICRLLQALHQQTGHIVTLSLRCGGSMQIVDFIEPASHAGAVRRGSRVPIIDSIIGTAYLSLHGEREAVGIIEQIVGGAGERLTVSKLRQLLERVALARTQGFVSGPAVFDGAPWALAVGLPLPESGMKLVLGMASAAPAALPGDTFPDDTLLDDICPDEQALMPVIEKTIDHWLQS